MLIPSAAMTPLPQISLAARVEKGQDRLLMRSVSIPHGLSDGVGRPCTTKAGVGRRMRNSLCSSLVLALDGGSRYVIFQSCLFHAGNTAYTP